jgi:ubiquinone/menaquinone biosynthesis C-methylase UbiE
MSYTFFDRFVARCRFLAARPHVRPGSKVCDIGCGLEAAFLRKLAGTITWGIGLDYQLDARQCADLPVVLTDITAPLPVRGGCFDHVVMLAVLEHLQRPADVLKEIHRILKPGGSLILTWPSARVDRILDVLHRLRIVSDEMESDEHQERIPVDQLQQLLRNIGFHRMRHKTFEFGLNNLMVAHKTGAK